MRLVPIVFSLVAIALSTSSARADLLPRCDASDSLITCAAADVGKPCQGGGACYAMRCIASGTTTTTMIFKCDVCAPIQDLPDGGGCTGPSNIGTGCGDGGTCYGVKPHCSSSKFACQGTAGPAPTGPPAGGGGSSGAGTGGGAGNTGTAGGGAGNTGTAGGGAGNTGTAGGGAGASGTPPSGGGGGCDVVPSATGPGAIVLGLLVVGGGLLIYDRRRRRKR